MAAAIILNKKLWLFLAAILFLSVAVYYAQAQPNASVVLQKDPAVGLFILTVTDPEGIKDFALVAPGKLPYGAGLNGCVKTFKNNNVIFADPDDFTPAMTAEITDCKGNITQLELLAPSGGISRGRITNAAPPPPAPVPTPTAPSVTEEAAAVPAPVKTKIEEPKTLPAAITYPVKELGNCQDETSCKLYCDDAGHLNECLAFAKKHNLIPAKEVAKAEKFLAIGKGPGGCDSQKSCEAYCSDVSRIDECLAFAEENGFMEGKELEEAKKISAYIKGGGSLPGGCSDRNSCEVYCSSGDHIDECLAFAESAGVIPPEELAEAKKFVEFMKKGETPGGCRSKEQCENFCADDAHINECIAFGEKAGFISPEEAEIAKKVGGKGPGDCRGKQQCEAYCQAHQEECFSWAQEHGLMKEEDLARMREGMQQFKANLDQMPPEMVDCLKGAVGEDVLNKLLQGEPVFARDLGEKMQSCAHQFEEQIKAQFQGQGFGPPGAEGGGGFPEGFSGPGGCQSPDECFEFCRQNPKECSSFGPPGGGEFPGAPPGGMPPGGGPGGFPGNIPSGESFVGPGGCATPEECIRYCKEPGHDKECKEFKTAPTTPYAGGAGPGGCGSVEECREYCRANPGECEGFISEETPSEVRCQAGFETKRDNKGLKYCSPLSCPEGQAFITDFYGRQACSPVGGGQQQYQQQDQQQLGACPEYVSVTQCPADQERFLSHDSPGCQLYSCRPKQQQDQQQYQQQLQQQLQSPPTLYRNRTDSLLSAVLGPFIELLSR